ncbi:hypothetical protein [Sedimentimonas flavescens]|uniref:hypothetical protein n=1 Tax=Sedimentimonas flavescens TaxID=2851012 RepID=UPI001C49E306|nr:hypothetical protein [Sedimentimonas flavescens]
MKIVKSLFSRRLAASGLVILTTAACSVRQQDLDAWVGQPVSKLDHHPIFQAMPVEVRRLPDGTEVRNYVNGQNVAACFAGAQATGYSNNTALVTGSNFCSTRFAACNNMFYIRNGVVQSYTPVGTGGARCFTDDRATPDGWRGKSLNI